MLTPASTETSHPAFTLDRPNQLLWRGQTPVKVPPKVFQLLVYLRDNPGRIVDYDELLDAVWPREFVQPEILKTYVKTIRRLLEDDAQTPRYIETRPRCGYRFIGELPERRDGPTAAPSRLVGRDAELASLHAAWRAADAGQRRFVFVSGEAGIGKTRLIDEFIARLGDDGPGLCRVDCAPAQHVSRGYSPVREFALEISRLHPGEAQTVETAGTSDAERLVRQIQSHTATLPLLLVLENLQWADNPTIDALSRLAYARPAARLLVVASYRASMPNDPRCPGRALMLDLLVHGAATELRLAPLERDDVRRLVLLNSPVPVARAAVDAIEGYAGGIPLIVSQLADRMVVELKKSGTSHLVEMLSRHEQEGEFVANAVPDVIRHALELELRQLGERARGVLECGSNSGFGFCAWGVSKVLGTTQVEVEELCRAMCGSDQLLRESGLYVFPDGNVTPIYAFRNRLYARLLLSGQSHARRDDVQQRFTAAVERHWGDEVGSVACEMTERFEAAREWSRAMYYAKLAVANARRMTTRTDTVALLRKGLQLSDRLPPDRRASEKDFFLRQLSQVG